MDRLIKPDSESIDVFFIRHEKCCQTFELTNLMHTMSVAISLTTTNPTIFSFSQPFSIIPPLKTLSFTLHLNNSSDHPPLSSPPDSILIRSSILPTGKAHQDDLRLLFSKPGLHIYKDATLPINFVGPHVAEFLLSNKSIYNNFLFRNIIYFCDESQLTSLLRIALTNGDFESTSALIEAGADVNDRDSEGEALISLAVKSGNADCVQLLIESGSVIDESDHLLHTAAAMNRVDFLELMHHDLDLNSLNSQGQTPLHLSAMHGNLEATQFLLSLGSEVDLLDNSAYTPLHYAAQHGHFHAVNSLLNHSVFSKFSLTKDNKTAFSLAYDNGYSELYDSLYLSDLLQGAARTGDVEMIKRCLDEGGKINGRDQNGWTPLHRAAFKGKLESVRVLVSHGARVDLVDGSGYTPLLRAVEGGFVEVAMFLLFHGAKVSLKNLERFELGWSKDYSSLVNTFKFTTRERNGLKI